MGGSVMKIWSDDVTNMTTDEIVQNYQVRLLKIIFKEIDSLIKKK